MLYQLGGLPSVAWASMGDDIDGSFGGNGPTKLEAARAAVMKMVSSYGGRVPFGLTAFDNSTGIDCSSGADILVEASRLTEPAPLLRTSAVKPGAFVGITGMPQADGTQRAV